MRIIIPIIVGSIIGYFTNWLAIKMLFRPYREKRILGFKLPFTPGLIPKERYRISESIGNTIGEYLLTPEKIKEVLFSKESKTNINHWINNKFQELKRSKRSILEVLNKLEIDDYNQYLYIIKKKIVDNISLGLKKEEVKDEILNYIEKEIYDKNKEIVLEILRNEGKDFFKGFLQSEELKSLLDNSINHKIKGLKKDNRSLKEIIPRETIYYIDNLIYNNREKILSNIKGFLHDPEIKKKIESEVEKLVYKNTNRIITTFISTEIISEKIVNGLYNYINSESSEEILSFLINTLLEKSLNTKISTISKELEYIYLQDKDKSGIDYIIKELSKDENIDKISHLLIENIRMKDKIIKISLRNLVDKKINENINSIEFKESLYKILDSLINNTLEKPISELLGNIDNHQIDKNIGLIEDIIYKFGQSSLLEIINLFNISKIVEEQINSFEVEYTEELILEIAERELNAITRLGALLGGIMGLLSPLLQMIV